MNWIQNVKKRIVRKKLTTKNVSGESWKENKHKRHKRAVSYLWTKEWIPFNTKYIICVYYNLWDSSSPILHQMYFVQNGLVFNHKSLKLSINWQKSRNNCFFKKNSKNTKLGITKKRDISHWNQSIFSLIAVLRRILLIKWFLVPLVLNAPQRQNP